MVISFGRSLIRYVVSHEVASHQGGLSSGFHCTENMQSRVGLNLFSSTLQSVLGCAVKSIPFCSAVPTAAADAFISQANQLALRAAAMGCGEPGICE